LSFSKLAIEEAVLVTAFLLAKGFFIG